MPVPCHAMFPVEVGAVVPEGIVLIDGIRLSVPCILKYICCRRWVVWYLWIPTERNKEQRRWELGTNSGGGGEVSDILVSNKVKSARLYNSHLATHFAVYVLTDLEFSVRNCRTGYPYRSHGNRVFQQNMYKYSL